MHAVLWKGEALKQLAAIRRQSHNNKAISAAVAGIDAALKSSPRSTELHISEGLYRITVPPLVAFYSILESDQVVEVAYVRSKTLPELN